MTNTSELKRTALASWHEANGAKMVDFAGWWMPVQYTGVREEHETVRSRVGLFDVSHMGEIRVQGANSLESVQWLTTNDASKLVAGQSQYSLFPNEAGGIVDDLFVYCIEPGRDYLLCVNAANVDKDWAFVQKYNRGADISNQSDQWSQIAVQGPHAMTLIDRLFASAGAHAGAGASVTASTTVPGGALGPIARFAHRTYAYDGSEVRVARTGYTGEDGVEIFVANASVVKLWSELLERGADLGARPIGLGARDTLRTEMKYSLYGNEIDDTTNPYDAGLGWVVKPQAKQFVGHAVIAAAKDQPRQRKLVSFVLSERGIPRTGYSVLSFDNREIGRVTSGTLSPTLNQSIGIAYVETVWSEVGSEFNVDIRGRGARAKVVDSPFVQTSLSKK